MYTVGALVYRVPNHVKRRPNAFCVKCVQSLTTVPQLCQANGPTGSFLRNIDRPLRKYRGWYDLIKYRQYSSLVVPTDSNTDFYLQAELIFCDLVVAHGKQYSNKKHFLEIIDSRLSTLPFQ